MNSLWLGQAEAPWLSTERCTKISTELQRTREIAGSLLPPRVGAAMERGSYIQLVAVYLCVRILRRRPKKDISFLV